MASSEVWRAAGWGPLTPTFLPFINPIASALQCSYHLYADDLQIYCHAQLDNTMSAIDKINVDLNLIGQWSKQYGLLVNPLKSQAIIIGSKRQIAKTKSMSLPPLSINGEIIPYTSTTKDLGILIDEHLSWGPQVNAICRKMYHSIHSLKRLKRFLPMSTRILLTQTVLLPVMDYGDVVFLDINEVLTNKLDRLLNLGIKYIFGLRKYDHVTSYRKQLQWLRIRERHNLHTLTLLYSVLHNSNIPSYLRTRFRRLCSHGLPLRSAGDNILEVSVHKTTFYGDSFTVQAARLWNCLDTEIRISPSIDVFRKRLKNHYLSLS